MTNLLQLERRLYKVEQYCAMLIMEKYDNDQALLALTASPYEKSMVMAAINNGLKLEQQNLENMKNAA